MDKVNSGPSLSGRIPRKTKKKQESFLSTLFASASFFIGMGLLILGAGVICYIAFRNPLSKLILDGGIIMCLAGFFIKLADICTKLLGGRV